MRTVFDSGAVTFDPLLPMLFPLGALLVSAWLYKTGAKPLYWKIAVGIAVLLAGLMVALPWIDHRRVQEKLASGAVESVEGIVSQHKRWTERRFDGTSKGVGVTNTSRYTYTTFEYFYVGDRFFSYVVNGYPSQASFTNAGDPPIPLRDGLRARLVFFPDSWNDKDLRIVRLELGPSDGALPVTAFVVPPSGAGNGSGARALPADFAAFRTRFAAAMSKGDAAAAKGMVNFPFRFGGHEVEEGEFDSLWMSLFSAPLRPCLATARPVSEGGRYTLFCGPYGYSFGRTDKGWKLLEFSADGEAM